MTHIQTMEALAEALRARLPLPSNFYVVNTRLILQTGVNLRKIKDEQSQDQALIRKVLDALNRMGVTIEGGSP